MMSGTPTRTAVIAQLRRFYFDTALVGGPYAPAFAAGLRRPGPADLRIDWPYEFRPNQSTDFTARLDAYPFTDEQRYAIDRGNAERLFPRLAAGKRALR